jgi:hypothetical protein
MNEILEDFEKFSINKYGFNHDEIALELTDSFKEWINLRINLPKLLVNDSCQFY